MNNNINFAVAARNILTEADEKAKEFECEVNNKEKRYLINFKKELGYYSLALYDHDKLYGFRVHSRINLFIPFSLLIQADFYFCFREENIFILDRSNINYLLKADSEFSVVSDNLKESKKEKFIREHVNSICTSKNHGIHVDFAVNINTLCEKITDNLEFFRFEFRHKGVNYLIDYKKNKIGFTLTLSYLNDFFHRYIVLTKNDFFNSLVTLKNENVYFCFKKKCISLESEQYINSSLKAFPFTFSVIKEDIKKESKYCIHKNESKDICIYDERPTNNFVYDIYFKSVYEAFTKYFCRTGMSEEENLKLLRKEIDKLNTRFVAIRHTQGKSI